MSLEDAIKEIWELSANGMLGIEDGLSDKERFSKINLIAKSIQEGWKPYERCTVDGEDVDNCVLDEDSDWSRNDCFVCEKDSSIKSRSDCSYWKVVKGVE
jgi:hypothetical protein